MKKKIIIGVLILLAAALLAVLLIFGLKKKSVNVEIIVTGKSTTVEKVELGEGERYENLKIISIGKDKVTYSFNGDEVTVAYGEIKDFYMVVYDLGTYNYQVKIFKE